MSRRARYPDIRDWRQDEPTAEVYAWVFSQPPETVITRLRENAKLWDALCEVAQEEQYVTIETLPYPQELIEMNAAEQEAYEKSVEAYVNGVEQRIANAAITEREGCAVIADSQHLKPGLVKGPYVTGWNDAIEYIAAAIRARGGE